MDLFNDYEENFKSILQNVSQSLSGATYESAGIRERENNEEKKERDTQRCVTIYCFL